VVDVLVSDPVADPNGVAFPFLGWPRMLLWTSPPAPESVLGHYRDWAETLIVHEETHLVHLLRPSRNPVRQLLARMIPAGPIPLSAPRWVMEGYATVVEGRLTGAGRPNSDLRASILRRWAQAGRLPSYARLASDSRSWHGMSMAYLMGSAYLEWLEERAGPGSLRNLWARMTARQTRGFDEAFRGVFGDEPQDLYDRFRAELTWRALEAERRGGTPREGELWQDLSWTVGAPALSPDGERLVVEVDRRERPSRLVVWPTAPDTKAGQEWEEKRRKLQERDPEDVPAVRAGPLSREPLFELPSTDGIEATTPRWTADGQAVLFVRFEPDSEGFLHPDLFRWTPASGAVRRLTRRADLRDPDPSPVAADPDWAVAVRQRDGFSSIVRVDLETGAEHPVTEPAVDTVYDRPRIAPDGRRIAFARHRGGSWELVVRDLDSGAELELAPPADTTTAAPAWSADGRTLFAVVGDRGFIDLWAFPVGDPAGKAVRLTRTQGAAFSPAPGPDGQALFYLSLESDGLDLRRLELTPEVLAGAGRAPDLAELAPAARPAPPETPAPLAVAAVAPARPYGLGRQELLPLLGGSTTASGSLLEIGLRGGDVVGRLDWLALGALSGDGGAEGGAVAATWRGWPVEVGFHLFAVDERPSEQSGDLAARTAALDLDRRGLELWAGRDWQGSGSLLRLTGRLLREEIEPLSPLFGPARDRTLGSLTAGWSAVRRRGEWRLVPALSLRAETGRTAGESWSRWGGTVRLALDRGDTGLSLSWRRDASDGVRDPVDLYRLGGAESSVLAPAALAGRITLPAFPFDTLRGGEHEGQRAELRLGLLPAPLFVERHRVWSEGAQKGDWLTLAGLEWTWSFGPLPIGRVPRLDVRAGLAQVIEEPFPEEVFGDDLRWWLVTVWRP
jgi:WD40-like Beta Propeller Repeat